MVRRAIVTGGASGIGATICARLAHAGYRVGVLDIAGSMETAATLPHAKGIACDVTNSQSVAAAFDAFGGAPDLVVNNAGIVRFGLLGDIAPEDFAHVIAVNLTGAFFVAREALQRMAPLGRGHIISLTSINAYGPGPGSGAYPASKAGVLQLMRQIAMEYGDRGIRANSIAPGFIDGGMSTPIYADPKVRAARSKGVPMQRLGTPDDVANAVLFLDSSEGAYINGHDLVVDGGVSHAVLKNLPRE